MSDLNFIDPYSLDSERYMTPNKNGEYYVKVDADALIGKLQAENEQLKSTLAQLEQQEPVALVDAGDEGLFVEIIYGENGSNLKLGDKLYARSVPAKLKVTKEQAAELWERLGLEYFMDGNEQEDLDNLNEWLAEVIK